MPQRIVLPTKLVASTQFIPANGWDFTSLLQPGETISDPVVTAAVWSGSDSNASAIISGAASVVGNVRVLQLIKGGILGTIYGLKCTVTTNLGQVLNLVGYLAIIPDLASASPISNDFIQTDSGINLTTDDDTQITTSS